MSDGFTREEVDLDFGYTRIPHGLWLHPDLTHLDRVLLGWLWSHDAAYLARLSTREVRRQFNGSSSVVPSLQRLVDLGFMERSTSARNRTQYKLLKAPWQALFGHRQAVDNSGATGPQIGAVGSDEWSANRTTTGPQIGADPVRKSVHREEQLEDQVRRTDDDDTPVDNSTVLPFKARSSSSEFDTAIKIAAKAIALKKSKGSGYEVSTRKGLVSERGDEVRSLLDRGLSAQEVAKKLVGDWVYVRVAMRELGMEYERPYDPDTGAYLAETVF